MKKADWLLLTPLARFGDFGLLLLRLVTGAFLIYQSHDNIFSAERMDEFVKFLTQFKFPAPELMAPLCVWAQFLCGVAFVTGLLTRWAGVSHDFRLHRRCVDGALAGSFPRVVAGSYPGLPRHLVCNAWGGALRARSSYRQPEQP